MKALHVGLVVCQFLTSVSGAQDLIFSDDFETGRVCWVWSETHGGMDLCFEMPFGATPPVVEQAIGATTEFPRVDVIIGLDTTGSMGGEINNLKASISPFIDNINALVPDCGFSVVGYDDFPCCGYGNEAAGDKAFYLLHRIMTASTPAGKASLVNAVDQYQTHHGEDLPESGWEMVFQVATGAGNGTGSNAVPPFDPATAPPSTPPAGEEIGEGGGVGLRGGSLPILVWITDVPSHNSYVTGNYYGPIPGVTPAMSIQALNAMSAIGGKIVGVLPSELGRMDLESGVATTGSYVTPDAWGVDDRPLGCAITDCCTGINGTGVSSVSGQCPLLFEINSDGTGLGSAAADAIHRLILFGTFDISATLADDPHDPVDALAAFVDHIEADPSAPPPCAQGLTAIDVNPVDGVLDTFDDVEPGKLVCFNLVLKTNTTVPPAGSPEIFPADILIWGDFVTVLETRSMFFRVTP